MVTAGGAGWGNIPHEHLVPHQRATTAGERDANRSIFAVATLPIVLIVGFVLGTILLGDPNAEEALEGWPYMARLVPFWLALELPSLAGVYWGVRARHQGERNGWVGVALNLVVFLFLTAVTLVGGTLEAFD